eukprot:112729-Pleurochrysis_carterae.AAC.1
MLFPWSDTSKSAGTIAQSSDGDPLQPPGLPSPRVEVSDPVLPAPRSPTQPRPCVSVPSCAPAVLRTFDSLGLTAFRLFVSLRDSLGLY